MNSNQLIGTLLIMSSAFAQSQSGIGGQWPIGSQPQSGVSPSNGQQFSNPSQQWNQQPITGAVNQGFRTPGNSQSNNFGAWNRPPIGSNPSSAGFQSPTGPTGQAPVLPPSSGGFPSQGSIPQGSTQQGFGLPAGTQGSVPQSSFPQGSVPQTNQQGVRLPAGSQGQIPQGSSPQGLAPGQTGESGIPIDNVGDVPINGATSTVPVNNFNTLPSSTESHQPTSTPTNSSTKLVSVAGLFAIFLGVLA